MIENKIGKILTLNSRKVQITKGSCLECCFSRGYGACDVRVWGESDYCLATERKDNTGICYKEIALTDKKLIEKIKVFLPEDERF